MAIPWPISSNSIAPLIVSAVIRESGLNGSGWWVTIKSACPLIASRTTPGEIVRQVMIRETDRRRSPTRSPTLSQLSANLNGASRASTPQTASSDDIYLGAIMQMIRRPCCCG